MADVLGRVVLLRGRQRATGPIRLLLGPPRLDVQVLQEQAVEAELPDAQEAGGQHRVGQPREGQAEPALQVHHVVVSAVEHLQRHRVGEERSEGLEVGQDERVQEVGPALRVRELDQAEPLGVVVQAVGLGVDGDRRQAPQFASERLGLVRCPDPDRGGPHATKDTRRRQGAADLRQSSVQRSRSRAPSDRWLRKKYVIMATEARRLPTATFHHGSAPARWASRAWRNPKKKPGSTGRG